jgi:hypothetical protein
MSFGTVSLVWASLNLHTQVLMLSDVVMWRSSWFDTTMLEIARMMDEMETAIAANMDGRIKFVNFVCRFSL